MWLGPGWLPGPAVWEEGGVGSSPDGQPCRALVVHGAEERVHEQRAPGMDTSRAVWGSWLCRCGCPSLTRDKINSGWMLEEAEPRRAEQWRKAVFQEPGE